MGREKGFVTNWNQQKQYGFVKIQGDDADLFLYSSNIIDSKLRSEANIYGLKIGASLSFEVQGSESARKSRLAVKVTRADADNDRGRSRSGGRGGGGGRRRSPSPRRKESRSRSRERRR